MESMEKDIQYNSTQLGDINEGRTYRIHGNIPENGKLFTVDFITNLVENGSQNVALRITGNVEENVLSRNYRSGTNWSDEEVFSKAPYKLITGRHIMIEVLILKNEFLIACNGFHCANFIHRFPYDTINTLEIRGDLDNIVVDRKITLEYPQRPLNSPHFGRIILVKSNSLRCCNQKNEKDNNKFQEYNVFEENDEVYNEDDFLNPNESNQNQSQNKNQTRSAKDFFPVPYFATFDKGILFPGCNITITGRVRAEAKYFTVTLQTGRQHWPPPGKCYHVKFKLFDDRIEQPPKSRGQANEIIATERGDTITLQLVCDKNGFSGFIFDEKLDFRPYKIHPLHVNTIVVRGDLKLTDILINT